MDTAMKWTLGIGVVLLGVAVVCANLDQIPAAVIIGIIGLLAAGVAIWDALYNWLDGASKRREGR